MEGLKRKNQKEKVKAFLKSTILSLSLLGMNSGQAEKIANIITSETAGTAFTIEGANRCLLGTVWHIAKYVDGKARVKLSGRKYKVKVLWKNEAKDLAIVEIFKRNGDKVKNCDKNPYVLDSEISIGEKVTAIGYPSNYRGKKKLKNTIESKKTRGMGEYNMIGDQQLKSGMSGGPVEADDGKVVGVNVGRYEDRRTKMSVVSGVGPMIDYLDGSTKNNKVINKKYTEIDKDAKEKRTSSDNQKDE